MVKDSHNVIRLFLPKDFNMEPFSLETFAVAVASVKRRNTSVPLTSQRVQVKNSWE